MESWDGKRYYSLNYFLREKFGEKVFKISLDAGFTCPNRDGNLSYGGCLFCSPRGSGDFTGDSKNLIEQFNQGKEMMSKKWKNGKYIAYFQAYSNTYGSVESLREKYYSILDQENVVGIAIATRPDCLQPDIIELLSEINKKTYLWVELGLQTVKEETAFKMNIGHKVQDYVKAVEQLKAAKIEVVTHIILGLPGETREDMLKTVELVSNTKTQGIKLHLLHLLKDTGLVPLYENNQFKLMEKDEYVELIVDALEIIPADMVIHRMTGDGGRESLIGPVWSLKKWEVINAIEHLMMDRDTWQGKKAAIIDSTSCK